MSTPIVSLANFNVIKLSSGISSIVNLYITTKIEEDRLSADNVELIQVFTHLQ